MKKRVLVWALVLCLLTGCSGAEKTRAPYQYMDYTLFDTVTTILGYGESQEAFDVRAQALCRQLGEYHRLLDIYREYEGLNNLKTVNDRAGTEPVTVDPRILDFLETCKAYYDLSDGRVNVAMGSVLQLWHQARTEGLEHPEQAALPDPAALEAAAKHCDLADVILDREAGTVAFADPQLRLDVGAAAKGWSVEQVCRQAEPGLLISVGGNVYATGPKPDGSDWVVGVQDPDRAELYLQTVPLTQGSAVTSGDYQRYYKVDGKIYHHIIDPDTLAPGRLWRSVTVLTEDSGLADCLSTALFLLPREAGQELLEKINAEAMWVNAAGEIFFSPGFPQ